MKRIQHIRKLSEIKITPAQIITLENNDNNIENLYSKSKVVPNSMK